jgi:hypothetical protein
VYRSADSTELMAHGLPNELLVCYPRVQPDYVYTYVCRENCLRFLRQDTVKNLSRFVSKQL